MLAEYFYIDTKINAVIMIYVYVYESEFTKSWH